MLLLGPGNEGFDDDADPQLRYRLPQGLRALPGPDGHPQVLLSRSPDGSGMLQLRLAAVWPSLSAHERVAPLSEGRFRLQWHTPTTSASGQWQAALVMGEALVHRAVTLSATEAAIAHRLAPAGEELVELELELVVAGRHPTFPWLARAPGPTLQARVLALLGPDATEWSDVEDAFAGLPLDAFEWIPLRPRALPPPPDEALRALARHAAPVLLARDDSGFVAAAQTPDQLAISLAVARAGTRRFGLRWSFSAFLAAQPDPSLHLVTLDDPDPFAAAELQLINDVVLDARAIRSIRIEIKTGGPSGRLEHTFVVGQPSAARLPFVREGYEPLAIQWRASAIVELAGRPATIEGRFRDGGLGIRIGPEHLGVLALRLRAQALVFEHVDAVEIELPNRTVRLTPAAPQSIVVGRSRPATLRVHVVLDDGTRAMLGDVPVDHDGLTIGAAELGVGDAAQITLRPPADLAARAAYLAVQVEDGPWRTLEAGAVLRWAVRRPTRLHTPRTRYRVRHVPRRADGSTMTITESAWHEAAGETVEVVL